TRDVVAPRLLRRLQHPRGGVLRVRVDPALPEQDLQRGPLLFVDLTDAVLRCLAGADVPPAVGFERGARGGGQALELDATAIDFARRLHGRRFDGHRVARDIAHAFRHGDVFELALHGPRRI